jgi:heme/copper-type cytochrome/quinol oxidase subunit 4
VNIKKRTVGILGLLAVITLITALLIFGSINKEFSFFHDFISKLGAKGEPNALWWNLIGFALVGTFLFAFGITYGIILKDNLLGAFLSFFGLGFALTAIPMDMNLSDSPVSKAHIVAICLGLAFWLFGLSRMGYNIHLHKKIRRRANISAVLLVASIIGFTLGFWSMPITHRLVFGIVFGWTTITSLELIVPKQERR